MIEYLMRTIFGKVYCKRCKKWQPYIKFIIQTLPSDTEYLCSVCSDPSRYVGVH